MSRSSNDEILQGFTEEVKSYVPSLIQGIESLKEEPEQSAVLEELHRLAHTIKGAASLMGVSGLSHIAYQMEEALEDVISGELAFSEQTYQVMSRTIEQFQEYCEGLFAGKIDERAMLKETVVAFRRLRDLPPDGDEKALRPLLESVPEPGGGTVAVAPERIAEKPQREVGAGEPYPELMEDFYQEADEHFEDVARFLKTLESQISEPTAITPAQREVIRQIRRSVHTLKGAAAVVGMEAISSWAHEMEDLLDWLYEEAHEISPEVVTVLLESADLLARIVSSPQEARSSKGASLRELFAEIMGGAYKAEEISFPSSELEPSIDMTAIIESSETVEEEVAQAPFEEVMEEISEVMPFRSARTLRVDMDRLEDLVNLAGELIIALSAIDQKMDIFTDSVNELELSRGRLREIARNLEVGYEVKAIQGLGSTVNFPVASAGGMLQTAGFDEFDALELDRYSEFNLIIRGLTESVVDVGAISTHLVNLYGDLEGYLNRQRVLLSELQDKMMRIRMTPMSTITNRLYRTVREVASNLGKKVRLTIKGEEIELDREIWEKITDPLMHLLRNAIDHGIEQSALRQALDKPPVGTIQVTAAREGNQVVLRIMDDGAGLNYEAIRTAARDAGASEKIDEMSEDELASLIFQPGFSTRSDITEVSGRGVGLDVVQQNIQDLKGTIRIASWPDKGTQFTIRIPLTLAAVRALLFTVGKRVFAVPLNEISEIIRVDPDDIMREPETTVRIGDEVLPLFYVAMVLGVEGIDDDSDSKPADPLILVVECGGKKGALVVDSLAGQREIVIKSLGSHIRYVKGLSGATIMGDGSVVPILNVEELLGAEASLSDALVPDQEFIIEKPLKIMVVDDSVSIRQVVSRLMESQGWKVQTAKDGVEALEKLNESRPDLVVLDLEMPRMNGFEFLSALRAQPSYARIPVVVLTSRTAAKHRTKATALGAKGFVVKPYDEHEFVNLILTLTQSRPQ